MSETAGVAPDRFPDRSPDRSPDRWLAGPVPDLVLGCGLGYLAWIALLWIPGFSAPLLPWIPFGTGLLALVTATPHYGATLLRVYEQRSDRRRYTLFAIHATLAIAAAFVAGVYWFPLGSLLVTAYVTWSPWHFAGQNYGLASMFLRRRGVEIDAATRRLLYASFALSFVLAFLALHRGEPDLRVAPVPVDIYGPYRILSLGIPAWLAEPAMAVVSLAYVGVLGSLAVALARRARAIDLLPSALLVLLQAVWFSIPAWLAWSGSLSIRALAVATVWISIAHAIQYLWVTHYYARHTGRGGGAPWMLKTLLAGVALAALPGLFFAPQLLGNVPYHAGLAGLLFSAINVHHFLLDGAIWKLRDGRIARVLLRAEDGDDAASPTPRLGPRHLVWTVGAVCLVITLVNAWEVEFGVTRAIERGDFERLRRAEQRLRWIGRDSEQVHYQLGLDLARRGETAAARRELERSLALYPRAETWTTLGNLERVEGNRPAALEALDEALALDPDFALAHRRRGETLAQMGDFEAALASLREARRLAPDDAEIATSLRRVRGMREAAAATTSPDREG